jgi:hypothetical protein
LALVRLGQSERDPFFIGRSCRGGVEEAGETEQEEIHDVHEALETLWMALSSIAAKEEDRRLRGDTGANE